jgi:putative transposase
MLPHTVRKPTRLAEYDYSCTGGYFITLVTQNREHLFGEIIDEVMQINPNGMIVSEEWILSPFIRKEVTLDAWCVMPNHFHAIVMIQNLVMTSTHDRDANVVRKLIRPRSLGSLVGGFKSAVTKRINEGRQTPRLPVWQRNYHDHIIRDEDDLNRIREYISNNPLKWELDKYSK